MCNALDFFYETKEGKIATFFKDHAMFWVPLLQGEICSFSFSVALASRVYSPSDRNGQWSCRCGQPHLQFDSIPQPVPFTAAIRWTCSHSASIMNHLVQNCFMHVSKIVDFEVDTPMLVSMNY